MFRRFIESWWWWSSDNEPGSPAEYTVENCDLSSEEVRLAQFTLKALGLKAISDALSLDDLVFLCYSVGLNTPEYDIESKLRAMGLAKLETFHFAHFLHLWKMLQEHEDEEDGILRHAFNFFDKDGNGEISATELKQTMRELGNLLGEDELDDFLSLMDTNQDGVIDYGEFIRLLNSQRPAYRELTNKISVNYSESPVASTSNVGSLKRQTSKEEDLPNRKEAPAVDIKANGRRTRTRRWLVF